MFGFVHELKHACLMPEVLSRQSLYNLPVHYYGAVYVQIDPGLLVAGTDSGGWVPRPCHTMQP